MYYHYDGLCTSDLITLAGEYGYDDTDEFLEAVDVDYFHDKQEAIEAGYTPED